MFFQQSPPLLRVTLLAGATPVLRDLVLEQLIAEAQADARRVRVLSLDRRRQHLPVDSPIPFDFERGQVGIEQAGDSLLFRLDPWRQLNTIKREGSADEVVIELANNADLYPTQNLLTRGSSEEIHPAHLARSIRSFLLMEAGSLTEIFKIDEAMHEIKIGDSLNLPVAGADASALIRSLECSDTVVITDSVTIKPEMLGKAIRLLRSVNPRLAIVDLRLFRFDSIPVPSPVQS